MINCRDVSPTCTRVTRLRYRAWWRVAVDRQTSLYYFYTIGNDEGGQWQHPGGDEQLMNLQVVLRDPATVSAG